MLIIDILLNIGHNTNCCFIGSMLKHVKVYIFICFECVTYCAAFWFAATFVGGLIKISALVGFPLAETGRWL